MYLLTIIQKKAQEIFKKQILNIYMLHTKRSLPSAGPARVGSWDALSVIRVPLKLKLADLFRACDFT